MRKLNNKNKLFIVLFSFIIVGIVALLVYSISLSGKYNNFAESYSISTNSVIYDEESVLLNTKQGGEINKSWDNNYYYTTYEGNNYELGDRTVIYEKAVEEVYIFGDNHFVSPSGNITKNTNQTVVSNTNTASFYKLDDRAYLIIANEIYTEDKTIYTSKYLMVNIDKQGNASFLNDVMNVKTINPLKITFDNYVFDIANEKLMVDGNVIDLKLINGSSNEYIPREKVKVEDADMSEFIDSYNKLVNDFTQYVNNANLVISGNTQIINNTIITNSNGNNGAAAVNNKTNISKRVSLRGILSYPTYLDVTYVVTDPEEKYQAVYLLVTGVINGKMTTEKIFLDKYDTKYRIIGLNPKSEYSVSLGYIEVVKDKETKLVDDIADVINVRTTGIDSSIKIDKIVSGYVNCNFKMTEKYAIDSGVLVLFADRTEVDRVNINYSKALSKEGFATRLKLGEGSVYEIRLEDAVYNGNPADIDLSVKFTYQSYKIFE